MRVIIDEQPVTEDLSHLRTLEEALVQIHDRFIPQGQQLFQVRVNGEFYTERYPRESRYIELQQVDSLELKTVPDAQLARYILTEASFQAETLGLGLERSAILFRIAPEDEAHQYFAQVLEALRWLLRTGEEASRLLQLQIGQVPPAPTGPTAATLARLQGTLDEMLKVYESEDYIPLADLLEYELLPLVREWQRILNQLTPT